MYVDEDVARRHDGLLRRRFQVWAFSEMKILLKIYNNYIRTKCLYNAVKNLLLVKTFTLATYRYVMFTMYKHT
jgi:hypothetical protein